MRGKRYALEIEDGKVKAAHVEPDNTGTSGTSFFSLISSEPPPLPLFQSQRYAVPCHIVLTFILQYPSRRTSSVRAGVMM